MRFVTSAEGTCVRRGDFVASALSATLTLAAAPKSQRVVVAYVQSLQVVPVMVAAERGFFTQADLEVELVPVGAAQDAVALLARGHLDVAAGGLSAAFFNAVHRGFDVRLAGGLAYIPARGHPSALMVRSDLYDQGIRRPQQLAGRRIGLPGGLGTSNSYFVALLIRPLTLADVDLVPVSGGDQGVALSRKSIAAVFSQNPFTQSFERKGLAKVIALPPRGAGFGGAFFGGRLLREPALAERVFSVLDRSVREIAGPGYYDPRNLAAYAKYVGQTAQELAREDRYAFKPGMPVDRATLDSMQRVFIVEKTLAYREPVSDTALVWKRTR